MGSLEPGDDGEPSSGGAAPSRSPDDGRRRAPAAAERGARRGGTTEREGGNGEDHEYQQLTTNTMVGSNRPEGACRRRQRRRTVAAGGGEDATMPVDSRRPGPIPLARTKQAALGENPAASRRQIARSLFFLRRFAKKKRSGEEGVAAGGYTGLWSRLIR